MAYLPCKLDIVLISLWGLMHKIYPISRYQKVNINLLLYSYLTSGYQNVSSLFFWDQYYNIAPYFCATKCD